MRQQLMKLLYRSFDTKLTPEEQRQLDQALNTSKPLQIRKARIERLREQLRSSAAQSFRPFFVERVVGCIRELQAQERNQEIFFEALVSVFRPVAVALLALLIVLLSYNFGKSDNKTIASALADPPIPVEEMLDPTVVLILE